MKHLFLKLNKKSGFAILFTVMISAAVLAITIGISQIAVQEAVLSSSAKEGATSFFAADTGTECALYWDIDQDVFTTGGYLACSDNGVPITPGPVVTFNLDLNNARNCARVTVQKDFPQPGFTQIESLGYNVSCAAATFGSPRLVERAIRVIY